MEKIKCLTCKKIFEIYPSDKNRKYCNRQCYIKDDKRIIPMKEKIRSDLILKNKDKEFSEKRINSVKKFFSSPINIEQRNSKTRETIKLHGGSKKVWGKYKGELNGNWKGGTSKSPYSFEFNAELKYAIRLREEFKCQICKMKEKDIPFPVHHIDYNKDNNNPENLVCLCLSCHSKTNSKRSYWIEYFGRDRKIEKEYLSWSELEKLVFKILIFLRDKNVTGIVPIPRGGILPALILANYLKVEMKNKPDNKNDIIVDEIVDFGLTLKTYKKKFPDNLFVCIDINKRHFKLKNIKPDFYVREVNKFIVYPWE